MVVVAIGQEEEIFASVFIVFIVFAVVSKLLRRQKGKGWPSW